LDSALYDLELINYLYFCKLGADPGSPYLFSLCANPLSWPLISQMSIHAQFILNT